MKLCAKWIVFVVVLAAALSGQTVFALDPVIRNETYKEQVKTFDRVESVAIFSLESEKVLTPSDTVSTDTMDIGYLVGRYAYPIELEIQNLGANPIYYNAYSSSATGAFVPLASNSATLMSSNGESCVSGKSVKMRFYRRPNLCFGGGTNTATATFIIRTMKGEEY